MSNPALAPTRTVMIPLNHDAACIDLVMMPLVISHKWTIKRGRHTDYAKRESHGKTIMMHREIMEMYLGRKLRPSEHIDHIDGNGLDNRLSNLRIATASQNQANRPGQRGSSIFKGVHYRPSGKRPWYAAIRVDHELIHLGSFETEVDAAGAYDKVAFQHFGEFAFLNFQGEIAAAQ